jgi:hypothetical protein
VQERLCGLGAHRLDVQFRKEPVDLHELRPGAAGYAVFAKLLAEDVQEVAVLRDTLEDGLRVGGGGVLGEFLDALRAGAGGLEDVRKDELADPAGQRAPCQHVQSGLTRVLFFNAAPPEIDFCLEAVVTPSGFLKTLGGARRVLEERLDERVIGEGVYEGPVAEHVLAEETAHVLQNGFCQRLPVAPPVSDVFARLGRAVRQRPVSLWLVRLQVLVVGDIEHGLVDIPYEKAVQPQPARLALRVLK